MKRTLALLSVLAFCIFAERVTASPPWVCVEAKDFVIMSNGSEKQARYLAQRLEAFRSVMTRMFQLRWNSDRPLTIMAFKDWDSFHEFELIGFAAGQFMTGGAEDVVILVLVDSRSNKYGMDAENILLHEYTHVLTAGSNASWPPWLREGLADVYSTFRIEGNKVIIGTPAAFRAQVLRGRELIPMKGFIKQHPKGHDITTGALFYPQAWALTHYLMFSEKQANLDKLLEYAHRCETGADSEQVFDEIFKIDYKTLETKLSEYIKREEFPGLEINFTNLNFQTEFNVRPLTESELLACYGNLMLNWKDVRRDLRSADFTIRNFDARGRADYYFRQALALDPQNYRAREGYGYLELIREDFKKAQAQFQQAIQLKPDNADSHYWYGRALYGKVAGGAFNYTKDMPENTEKAIYDEAVTALKLNKRAASAYDLLARLCLLPGQSVDEGLRLIDTAIRARPRNNTFKLTRGYLLLQKGDADEARKTFTALVEDEENVPYKIQAAAKRGLDRIPHAEKKH